MTFAHPHYFHLLWLLLALVLLRLWMQRGTASAAGKFVAPRLRELLVVGLSPGLAWLIFIFQLLALAGFIGALTGPKYGVEKREVTEKGRNVLIAIDTSRSMLADDVTPNRLLRAKLAAEDIVATLNGERVGLIAFAGRGYLQAPLTTDHDAVIESLQSLDTNTIPRGGTTISDAIREALEAIEKSKAHTHGMILFSDGGDDDDKLDEMLQKAREKKLVILTVGVGTDSGSLIPDPDPEKSGDFIRDPGSGKPVLSRLEEATLQKMAKETGGRYLRLGSQALSASVVASVLSTLDALENGNREEEKPIDRFYWPLSAGMLFLMIALLLRPTVSMPRLSPAALTVIGLLVFSLPAQASIFGRPAPKPEDAREAYQSQDYATARDVYSRLLTDNRPQDAKEELSYGLGAASHQLKEYDRAIEGFSRALQSKNPDLQLRSHQGLATSLYDQGAKSVQQQPEYTVKAWEDSVRHFDAAANLSNDPKTKENLSFVKKQLEELKKKIEQENDGQKKKGKKDKNKQQGNGDKDKGDQGEEDEDGQDQDGKKPDQKDGKQGQEKDGKEQQANKGKSQDGEEKEGKQGGKDGEEKDGQQMAQQEQKDKGPEGKIQAQEQKDGDASKEEKQKMAEAMAAEEKKQDQTGYSRNEARNLLRTYNDLMAVQQQRRREKSVAKDW